MQQGRAIPRLSAMQARALQLVQISLQDVDSSLPLRR